MNYNKHNKMDNLSTEKEKASKPKKIFYFSIKRLQLFLFSALSLFAIYVISPYQQWYTGRILNYYRAIKIQKQNLKLEERKKYRYGTNYVINQTIKKHFTDNNIENPVLLLPPKKYLEKNKYQYDWQEIRSFYYFTGIKLLVMSSNEIDNATHALIADKDDMRIVAITNKAFLKSIIEEYKKHSQ